MILPLPPPRVGRLRGIRCRYPVHVELRPPCELSSFIKYCRWSAEVIADDSITLVALDFAEGNEAIRLEYPGGRLLIGGELVQWDVSVPEPSDLVLARAFAHPPPQR